MSTFEEALDSITETNISICKERKQALCHQLRSVISPMQIELPTKGSIRVIYKKMLLQTDSVTRGPLYAQLNRIKL